MVHFVGAGSGAPDLITVRGARLLGEADIVIYAGSLVNPALLDATKPGCEIHDSAKMTLEEVIAVIRQAEAEGKTTVRLHTGDSSIYGAVREQFDALEKLGIESPVTLEDWENYWHLVKTTDLNGNGTRAEATDLQCLYTYLTSGVITGALAQREGVFRAAADLNGDGSVDVYDLQRLYETASGLDQAA